MIKNQKGFTGPEVVLLIFVTALLVGGGVYVYSVRQNAQQNDTQLAEKPETSKKVGVIKGQIGYPAEESPKQTVCAENINNSKDVHCVDVKGGKELAYSLEVPAGTYNVYAKIVDTEGTQTEVRAYYNEFVKCGLSADCPESGHSKYIDVEVANGQTVSGVNPTDWYNN